MAKPGIRRIVGSTNQAEPVSYYSGRGYYVDRETDDVARDPRTTRPNGRLRAEQAANLAAQGGVLFSRTIADFELHAMRALRLTKEQEEQVRAYLDLGQSVLIERTQGHIKAHVVEEVVTTWTPAHDEREQRQQPRVPLGWDETFMRVAETVKLRSKDPMTQTGAVLVAPDHRVLSIGYNGMPNGVDDLAMPWDRDAADPLDTKYPYVIHAERNAVLNFRGSLRELAGATAYVTHYPCNECAKELIQVGVSRVIYARPYDMAIGLTGASRRLFEMAGIETIEVHSNMF